VNEAVIVMIKSVKMIMMIMKITLNGYCVLTSMRRGQVKNPGYNNRDDVVVMRMVNMRILTTEIVVIVR
jgi:hypothetical protein